MEIALVFVALVLAFSNGANDNFKGFASVCGSAVRPSKVVFQQAAKEVNAYQASLTDYQQSVAEYRADGPTLNFNPATGCYSV